MLIKSAGNKVRLVKEFQKWGAFVLAQDLNEEAPAIKAADGIWLGEKVDFVLETRDADIKHPICWDKYEFYKFCRRHGFRTPITAQFEAIVKHRNGSGSREQFRIGREHIIQEIVQGQEYSIDYFADFNGLTLSVIPRKRLNVVDGESQDCEISYDPFLINEATRMGQELGIKGPAVMQCFYDNNLIKWIECNARFGGGSHFTWHIFSGPKWIVDNFTMRESNVQTTSRSTEM